MKQQAARHPSSSRQRNIHQTAGSPASIKQRAAQHPSSTMQWRSALTEDVPERDVVQVALNLLPRRQQPRLC